MQRFEVMYNDFVLVGPPADPAGVKGTASAAEAMAAIAAAEAPFASRGDDSGTHQAEKALWAVAGVMPSGDWYRETGSGMGATLNMPPQMQAYSLTDRGTWISFENRGDLEVLFEGDPALFNQYGVILVNPEKHPTVKTEAGQAFIDWLISEEGQAAIASLQDRRAAAVLPERRAAVRGSFSGGGGGRRRRRPRLRGAGGPGRPAGRGR